MASSSNEITDGTYFRKMCQGYDHSLTGKTQSSSSTPSIFRNIRSRRIKNPFDRSSSVYLTIFPQHGGVSPMWRGAGECLLLGSDIVESSVKHTSVSF